MNSDGAFSLPLREPPASIEAEQALIGSCLLDPEVIDEAAAILDPTDFWRDAHGELWRAIVTLRENGRDVNAVTLHDFLGARAAAMKADDMLAEILRRTPHAANGKYFAAIVHGKATVRRLVEACNETLRDCYANESTPDQLVDAAEARVFAISEREAGERSVDAQGLLLETFQAIESREAGDLTGVLSGFGDLDYMTSGFRPQDLVIAAARPSMGKTAFACAIAVNASQAGVPVLIFSLEMNRQALGERFLSSEAKVAGDQIRRSWELSQDERRRLHTAVTKIGKGVIEIDDRPMRSVSQMAATARRMRARRGLGLVVIDYLSLIDGQRQRGENRQEEVARISRRLKAMARELDCPVLCLHQLNRQNEAREGHRPRLSDLRESGQIEQDADMVLLLHRPEYYDPNDQPGVAEVIVAKNRNGPTGAVRLAFMRAFTRFEPLTSTTGY